MPFPPHVSKRTSLWVALSALYYLGLCAYVARQNMMWVDEFCSWNVLADPSWRHAFASYSNGADSGGVLFYLLGRFVLSVFGLHPLVIRFFSSLAFWLAGWLWWVTLRRLLSPFAATGAVLVVWLGSGLFFFHAGEVRFYGLFFLTFSLAAAHLLNLERFALPRSAAGASTFAIHLMLVTSHTIGLLYSAALLIVVLLSRHLGKWRWQLAAAIVASWSVLLLFRQALSQQARISWMVAPDLRNFFRYYEKTPLTGALPNILFFATMVSGLVIGLQTPAVRKKFKHAESAMWLTLLLLLTPPAFAIVSQLGRPIAADRYMMPAICGFLMAFAASLFVLEERYQHRISYRERAVMIAVLALFAVAVHARMLAATQLRPASELNGLLQLKADEPVVLDDTNAFFQMRYYYSQAAQSFVQIAGDSSMATPTASGNAVLLRAGYLHQVFAESAFLSRCPRFLYVDTDPAHGSWLALYKRHPGLHASTAGQIAFGGRMVPVLQVTHR